MHCWKGYHFPALRMELSTSTCSARDCLPGKSHWSTSMLHSQTRNFPIDAPVQILRMHPSEKLRWQNKYRPENSSIFPEYPSSRRNLFHHHPEGCRWHCSHSKAPDCTSSDQKNKHSLLYKNNRHSQPSHQNNVSDPH